MVKISANKAQIKKRGEISVEGRKILDPVNFFFFYCLVRRHKTEKKRVIVIQASDVQASNIQASGLNVHGQ
jgi:hypothetical protein